MKILIVDDEKGIVSILKNYFQMQGYFVYTAFNGTEALTKICHKPDIILLDITMPKMDGLTLCKHIRQHISCPILFLTARIETADKLIGFEAGADDYIVKPFDLDELGARVQAHLRRENRKQEQGILRFFGDMSINYSSREVKIGHEIISFSNKEFEIIKLLSVNPSQIFDREKIYTLIWGLDGEGSSDTIMEHVRKIRAKFAAVTTRDYIQTVWGVGYKWNG